jgi:glycosylphosphatidylinositol transamidase (GPIT) subunit GPI8
MKAKFASLLLVVSVVVLTSFGQLSSFEEVIGAIRSGNATELSKYFDENVQVTLPVKSDSYSKAQAQMILKDFFANNDVRGFELKHKGDSPGGQYCIGTLQTKSGNFRAHIFMKTKGSKDLVKELRFQSIE